MKKETVLQKYKKWMKANGIKKGDTVQVFSSDGVFMVSKLNIVMYGQEQVLK